MHVLRLWLIQLSHKNHSQKRHLLDNNLKRLVLVTVIEVVTVVQVVHRVHVGQVRLLALVLVVEVQALVHQAVVVVADVKL
jgi:hypothetical protein